MKNKYHVVAFLFLASSGFSSTDQLGHNGSRLMHTELAMNVSDRTMNRLHTKTVQIGNNVDWLTVDTSSNLYKHPKRYDVYNKLCELIANKLKIGIEKVKPNSSFFDDLGVDSLEFKELIIYWEKEFDIEISNEDLEKIKIVENAFNIICNKLHCSENQSL